MSFAMRVLHLTTEFPWPATSGGSVRTVSQLRILASLPEVEAITMLSVAEKAVSAEDRRALASAIPKLTVLPPVFHPVHLFDFKRFVPRVVALRALRGVPYLAGKWDSRRLRRLLREELRERRVDVVYIDHLGMARYLGDIDAERPRAHVVLDQHNVESDFFKQFAAQKKGPKKLVAQAEWQASARFEKTALRGVDSVVAISKEDARHFDSLASVRAEVVPMVMAFERKARPAPSRPNLCYVGNLRWHPNVAGLDWFCQKVWPLVRARIPDATFEIAGVGLKPDASGALPVPEAWKVPGVQTIGFMDDLEPLYQRSFGMLAPVFGGSGVRVKMLEGFRAGMPVVTTPDGAFGLPLEDGREALIAKDEQGFAERVERLVRDGSLRERVRAGGYQYLDEYHSLAVAQRVMRRVLGIAV
ncbi:Glycosyltransferase [Labilithrix luteola]|uniref:Glycosyltransferase n=1 Tax=Labilithrix luteola TaxID=1391654 RepID=A0A0K1PQN0_9BACT|nr:glycosyltransferase family 4 protein [Labilithrix luteola]AKU95424.1 Glycosyltransferase [Labilithrix luteola]